MILPVRRKIFEITTFPNNWLVDYSTAVSIANGNKRVAMKYVPRMLQGTARTWLNSLKSRSINSWVDFTSLRPQLHQHVQAAAQTSPALLVRARPQRVDSRLPHTLGRAPK